MFTTITDLIYATGAFGVGVVMLLENVFPPIPSELVMPLAGYLTATGRLSAPLVLLAGTVGAVAGAWLWYLIGARLGEARLLRFIDRFGPWFTLSRADVENALSWFRRHQGAAVFFGRMVPGLRTMISVPAGLAGMPLRRFLLLTAAGSAIWNTALMAAGYVLAANYARIADYLDPVTTLLLAGLVISYLWRVYRQFRDVKDI